MALVRLAPRLLVDRYHRGAVVLSGISSFAVNEAVAGLLDRIHGSGGARLELDAEESSLLSVLIERGWVEALNAGT